MTQENPYDLRGQRRREQAKKTEDERKRAEYLLDLNAVMKTTEGQRVLRAILVRTHAMAKTFSVDPYVTAHREGERAVGLSLIDDMSEANAEVFNSILKGTIQGAKNDRTES